VSHAGGGITVTTGANGTVFSVRFTGAEDAAGQRRADVGGGRR
jgi:two-component system CitB family sensor kinase